LGGKGKKPPELHPLRKAKRTVSGRRRASGNELRNQSSPRTERALVVRDVQGGRDRIQRGKEMEAYDYRVMESGGEGGSLAREGKKIGVSHLDYDRYKGARAATRKNGCSEQGR